MKILKKIGLAVFKDRKILMARSLENKEIFYFLGGKVNPGESDFDCLDREIKEEVCTEIDKNSLKFLDEFTVEAFGKPGVKINLRLYKGELLEEPKPCSEVVELKYFDSTADEKKFTPLTRVVFAWLQKGHYIN